MSTLTAFRTEAEDLADAIEATELALFEDDALDKVRPTDMQGLGQRLAGLRHQARVSPLNTSAVEHRVDELEARLGHCKDAYAAARADRANDDMRRISAWGAVIVVESFIAGFYGMNFTVLPFVHDTAGILGMIAFMGGLAAVMHHAFKRRGWL